MLKLQMHIWNKTYIKLQDCNPKSFMGTLQTMGWQIESANGLSEIRQT
jgi:hypothetical protein